MMQIFCFHNFLYDLSVFLQGVVEAHITELNFNRLTIYRPGYVLWYCMCNNLSVNFFLKKTYLFFIIMYSSSLFILFLLN